MTSPDSVRKPDTEQLGPSRSQTNHDFVYLLLSVGAVLLAFGAVLAAFDGLYSTVVEDAAAATVLAYLSYRFSRSRRKAAVHNLNI